MDTNTNKVVTISEVDAAFDTLLEVIARECDSATFQTALFVKEDVLNILGGEWADGNPLGKAAEVRRPAAEAEEGPDVARCSACGQSLAGIRSSGFACPECYGQFGDEAVDGALAPF